MSCQNTEQTRDETNTTTNTKKTLLGLPSTMWHYLALPSTTYHFLALPSTTYHYLATHQQLRAGQLVLGGHTFAS